MKLGKQGKQFYNKITKLFTFDDIHDTERLHMAASCLDAIEAAEVQIEKDGLFCRDRYGQTKEHPGCKLIRDNKIVFCRIIRELGLDLQQAPESRIPGRY